MSYPNASQIRELCTELKFLSKIGEGEKIHVSSQSFQQSNSLWTWLVRMLSSESNKTTIKFVREKTNIAIDYCDQLLAQPQNRDLLDILRDDLEDCVASGTKKGLEELKKTYSNSAKANSELDEIIRYVRLKLNKYNETVGLTQRHYKVQMLNNQLNQIHSQIPQPFIPPPPENNDSQQNQDEY